MRMQRIIGLSSLLLVSVAILWAGSPSGKAPNFSLKTSTGETIELNKLKGKVVVVNFWATWCGPCKREIPDFMEVYDQYRDKGLEIIGISLDRSGWNVVKPYMEKKKINYPIVLGNADLADAYGGINYIPTTFLIDREGNVVGRHVGLLSRKDLEEQIKAVL